MKIINKIEDVLSEIKWAHQRVVKGYDDRLLWGFDGYFEQFIPALKLFCQEELSKEYIPKYNKHKAKVFTRTLVLIDEYEKADKMACSFQFPGPAEKLWGYFGKYIGYFWD